MVMLAGDGQARQRPLAPLAGHMPLRIERVVATDHGDVGDLFEGVASGLAGLQLHGQGLVRSIYSSNSASARLT